MMALLPDLVGRIRLDMSELTRAQGEAQSRGAAIGSALGTAVGSLAGGLLAAAGQKVMEFVSGSIDAFARLEDATSVTGVRFGEAAHSVEDFASRAATSLGMSKGQALEAANTFSVFGKQVGLTGEPLAQFSTGMVQLAGDMASFVGTSPEEAIQAIGAAFRGEYDPIEKYGVSINAAAVEQEALRMGLIKQGETMTQAQKVMATQSLITKQTADAAGDFARTSDSVANTQKRVAAETENAQAELGQRLAPAYLVVLQAINQVIGGVTTFLDGVSRVVAFLWEWRDAITAVGVVLLIMNARMIAFNAVMAAWLVQQALVNTATKAWTAVQWLLNAALTANPIGLVIAAVAALVAGIIVAYNHSETFRRIVDQLFAKLKEFIDWCGPAIAEWATKVGTSFMQAIQDLENFGTAVNNWIEKMRVSLVQAGTDIGNWGAKMKASLLQADADLDTFADSVAALPGKAQTGLSAYLGILQTQVVQAWNTTRDASVTAINFLVTESGAIVNKVQNALAPFVGMLRDKVVAAWEALPPGIRQPIEQVVNAAVQMGRDIINALVNLPSEMVRMGHDIIGGLLSGLQARGQEIVNYLTNLIPGPVRQALGIHSPSTVMLEIGNQTMQGLINGLQQLMPQVNATLQQIMGFINQLRSALGIHSPSSVMDEIGQMIMQGLHGGLESWLPKIQGILDQVIGMVQKTGTQMSTAAKSIPGALDDIANENWNTIYDRASGTIKQLGISTHRNGNVISGDTTFQGQAVHGAFDTSTGQLTGSFGGRSVTIDARSFGTQLNPQDVINQILWKAKAGGLVPA